MRLKITGGRVIDPANRIDRSDDVYLADGRIAAVGRAPDGFDADRTLDATGRIVCPGFVDLCTRLREPGFEHKASIASESQAAVAGGFTTLVSPPDTDPVIDTPAVVELIHQRATQCNKARVEVLGALTQGLKSESLAEIGALRLAGCVGVSNGPNAVTDTEVMRRALEYASTFGLTVFAYAEDPWLAKGKLVHDGEVSTRLGLAGIPDIAETIIVARELLLVEQTRARVHFCQLSTGAAVDMVRDARDHGLPVSADVAIHQLLLTDADIDEFDSQCHVRPPFRSNEDRERLIKGVDDGTINAVTSAHQPHEVDAKQNPFAFTEPGISALDTLLPLLLRLVNDRKLSLKTAISAVTTGPANVLGLQRGTLAVGARADLCIFDPDTTWVADEVNWQSRGHNSPFFGQTMQGRVCHTIVGGRFAYNALQPTPSTSQRTPS